MNINTHAISAPDILQIRNGSVTFGANQMWYPIAWRRKAGCGPTACAHLIWYLSRTQKGCEGLCAYDGSTRNGFLQLMEDMWHYVTPGNMGVNSTELFEQGALRYGQDKAVPLQSRIMNIPVIPHRRPSIGAVTDFLCSAFSSNLPVAFLNLSNGSLRNLESWHWVTLVSVAEDGSEAVMYDQGYRSSIQLKRWLETTTLGGGLIALEPTKQKG